MMKMCQFQFPPSIEPVLKNSVEFKLHVYIGPFHYITTKCIQGHTKTAKKIIYIFVWKELQRYF